MKRNTRFWKRAAIATFVISGIFYAIGIVADLFGLVDGISERSDAIRSVLTILAARWKWMIGITAVLFAVVLYFSWKKKKEMEEMDARKLSWFDAGRRNTAYMGGLENRYQLKRFMMPRDEVFSWWAVTGVAGIGKTRLAIEVERLHEFRGADVQWLRHFEDYREDALKQKVDSMLESGNFRNIIIADDAQLYMDNIGALIEYIYRKNAEEMGDHRIRLLLLMRMGEDEDLGGRFKQLETKAAPSTLKKTKYGNELKIEKYSEEDVAEIVRSYAVVTAKKRYNKKLSEEQLSDMQEKAVDILKSERVDPCHLRPLFAMFITDALLAGKEPMSWDRKDILEYAVGEREDELLMWETRDIREGIDGRVYDMVRGIVSLAIIRDGIKLSALEGIREDLEKELNLAGISMKDFLSNIQLLAKDGIIRVHMPDTLAEYYVLRTLVIETDSNDEVVRWVISQLTKNMVGVPEFREKVRQDFRYIYDDSVNGYVTIKDKLDDFYYAFFEQCSADLALDIVKRLLAQLDLQDSNAIILHEAIQNIAKKGKDVVSVAEALCYAIGSGEPDIEAKRTCFDELRSLSEANTGNAEIVYKYSCGLSIMLYEELGIDVEESRKNLGELRRLSEAYEGNEKIVLEYSRGLSNMIIAEPDIEGKQKYFGELRRLTEAYEGNKEFVNIYSHGLCNVIIAEPDIERKRKYFGELRSLAETNVGNEEIMLAYSIGLFNMISYDQRIEERRKHIEELRSLAETNAGNEKIVLEYSKGLVNMTNGKPVIEEERKLLGELRRLSEAYAGNAEIVHAYSMGLFNMINDEQGIEEKRKHLEELRSLAEAYAGNEKIIFVYSIGLKNMMLFDEECFDEYLEELYGILSDNKLAKYVAKENPDIITFTRRNILDYERRKGIIRINE